MKFLHDDVLAGGLDYIVANCDGCFVCTSDVATTGIPDWSKVSGTSALTSLNVMSGVDFSESDGDISGRKLEVAEQADISITADGTAEHIVLVDNGSTKILVITECTPEAILSGNLTTIPAWDIEIEDPQP